MSDKSTDSGPIAWALSDVDAPEPRFNEPTKPQTATKAQAKKGPSGTHSGTDPLGRAIGPKEDPAVIKKVRDPISGKVETPDKDTGLTPTQAKAIAKEAEKASEGQS